MKIALAQIDTTVGALARNRERVIETLRRAAEQGAELVIFPELTLTGYPPLDLLDRPSFIRHNLEDLQAVAAATRELPAALLGYVDQDPDREGKGLYNAVALLADGKVQARRAKTLLPTYDVFDEMRYFDPATENRPVEFRGLRLGLTVCEDIWNDQVFWGRLRERRRYARDPVEELARQGIDLLVNVSASPFTIGKQALKEEMFRATARRHGVPLVHLNLVGGNDSLIFDGASRFFDTQGRCRHACPAFAECLDIIDTEAPGPPLDTPVPEETAAVHDALILGLRDYLAKCGFRSAVLGLSGGIDSAVTAALAVRALGPERVVGVAMPSEYSSEHSRSDARRLAENLGIEFHEIPIAGIYRSSMDALAPAFGDRPFDLAEENLQARIRGNLLMALSNKFGHILLTTGNKSEMAVGYCTLYGDMNGGLAVLSDVPKTLVYRLARHINRDGEVIPLNSIDKPPSAELRPDQLDSDSLPDYEILDPIIKAYVEEGLYVNEIVERGFDRQTVERITTLIERNEYKRRQAAVGLKITHRAFGHGRRMPVARGRDREKP